MGVGSATQEADSVHMCIMIGGVADIFFGFAILWLIVWFNFFVNMFLILCLNLVIHWSKFIKFLFSLFCTLNLYPCCFCKLLGFVFMHL